MMRHAIMSRAQFLALLGGLTPDGTRQGGWAARLGLCPTLLLRCLASKGLS